MSQFSLIYLFVFIINIIIFTYLLCIKKMSRQIRAFIIMQGAYLITLLCFVVFLSAHDIATMKLWLDISHYSGPIVNVTLLYLVTTFYYNDNNPPVWIIICILLSVIPLLARDMFGFMDKVSFIPNSIGNIVVYKNSLLSYYFYIHSFVLLFCISILFIIKIRTTKIMRLKKLSVFLLVITWVTWVLTVPCNLLISYIFKKYEILVPATGYLFYSVMIFALFYAVFKYNFMKINIPYTIENIMRRISDSILLTDTEGNIVQVNDAARELFGSFKENIENINILQLFPDLARQSPLDGESLITSENYSEFRKLTHPKKRNQILDVVIESVLDSFGDFIGLLIICRRNNKFNQARQVFGLTDREIEITTFLYDGLEYHEIAEKLNLSMNTVRNHIQNIYSKTGAKNKTILLKTLF